MKHTFLVEYNKCAHYTKVGMKSDALYKLKQLYLNINFTKDNKDFPSSTLFKSNKVIC